MARQEIVRLRRTTLWLVAVSYLAAMILAFVSGLSVDYRSFLEFIGVGLFFMAIFSIVCPLRGMRRFGYAGETTSIIFLLLPPVLVGTYLSMMVGMPETDPLLLQIDTALGFDWRSFIGLVEARPGLAALLAFAYQSFQFQLLLLPFALCLFGKTARAYRLCIGYILICAISCIISVWFPALGTYATFASEAADLDHINTFFGFFFLEQFHGVRHDPQFVLSLDRAAGILTFPSVHAGVAALCLWGGWAIPVLRYPVALLNVLMGVSAITHGSHYLVDVLAGLVVAAVSLSCVTRMSRTKPASLGASGLGGFPLETRPIQNPPAP